MGKIEHVVVLMLENRSFDHVLGWLSRTNSGIDGLHGGESNPTVVASPFASRVLVSDRADWDEILPFDPPHEFSDVTEQIFGTAAPRFAQQPSMDGFLQRASRVTNGASSHTDFGVVMRGYAPDRLPAIHALAREFVVCDRWFASVPGPTFPNRFFAHCATAGGFLDGKVLRVYDMMTIFNRLESDGREWKIYFHDLPQALTLARLVPLAHRFQRFGQFLSDAKNGELPAYAFIEPNYSDLQVFGVPNDQHPPSAMRAGDNLVRDVYEALSQSPQWESTLLLVTWDEHGGFFDHVAPPAVVSPDGTSGQFGFAFDRLGVRVPALVISPLVPRGFVDHTVYEHASIPATLGHLFGLEPLTERDRHAATFDRLAILEKPRATPLTLPRDPVPLAPLIDEEDIDLGPAGGMLAKRTNGGARRRVVLPLTNLQRNLAEFAERIRVGTTIDDSPATPVAQAQGDEQARMRAAVKRMAGVIERLAEASNFPRKKSKPLPAKNFGPVRNVLPDKVDLRDRAYAPRISVVPPWRVPPLKMPYDAFDQGETGACTGYALAGIIDYLLTRLGPSSGARPGGRRTKAERVSPRMIYSMARRYDEFPGATSDTGSSLRGALKGWFRNGVCRFELWDDKVAVNEIPPAREGDWWRDAFRRPLGAYYRVDTGSVADLQAAIHEAGVVYASAMAHDGWLALPKATRAQPIPSIPYPPPPGEEPAGHAFALVGYDEEGFYVFNSWGKTWGAGGYARLSYADWLNAKMDAWVVQLGVPTADHRGASQRTTLAVQPSSGVAAPRDGSSVILARDPSIAEQELSPFILNAENHGRLSRSGRFRTQPDDVRFLLEHHVEKFRKQHRIAKDAPTPVTIYAHGGLVNEDAAAETARQWIPAIYATGRFPIFIMWETGLVDTLANIVADQMQDLATAGASRFGEWLDKRLETLVAPLGTALWSTMKRNAAALTHNPAGLFRYLFEPRLTAAALTRDKVRLELIGHSAGSIVQAELAAWLIGRGYTVDRIAWMAPAIRVDRFDQLVRPHLGDEIRQYEQYSLTESAERADPTVPTYGKSLLYLVSRAFEGGSDVPILGMAEHYPDALRNGEESRHARLILTPGPESKVMTHGAYADDAETRKSILAGHALPTAAGASPQQRGDLVRATAKARKRKGGAGDGSKPRRGATVERPKTLRRRRRK